MLGDSLGVTHGRDKVKAYRGHFEPYFSSKAIASLHPIIGEAVDTWIKSLPTGRSLDLMKSDLTSVPLRVLVASTYGDDVMRHHLGDIKRLLRLHNIALAPGSSGLRQMFMSFIQKYVCDWPSPEVRHFNEEWEKFHSKMLEEREKHGWENPQALFFLLHDHIKAGMVDLSYKQVSSVSKGIKRHYSGHNGA